MKTANPDFYNSKDWMVIPYPVFKGGKDIANTYYFQYYMVNSQIPQNEQIEAWKFIFYMLSHGEDYLEKVALTQPTKKVFEGSVFKSMPYSNVFYNDLKRAHVVYFSSFSWRVNELIKEAIENVMMNKVNPADAVAKLKKDVQALVDENR
jgi:multiple sugar transport system substrate-binding protein